ncbi:hypothetical protein ACYOEI_42790 [Singulisphaera rosea]
MDNPKNRGRRERAIHALSWIWASCEQVARSEVESLEVQRPLWEVWSVNAHQLYCPGCRRFRRQSRSLAAILRRLRARGEGSEKLAPFFLPTDVRHRIEAALESEIDPGGSGPSNAPSA